MSKKKVVRRVTCIAAILIAGCGLLMVTNPAKSTTAAVPQAVNANPSNTGEITGKVAFQGVQPKLPTIKMDADPVCAELHTDPASVEDGAVNSDGTLPNVFVYVEHGAENYNFAVPTKRVILDQHTCVYQPHVLGVMVGEELLIVSSDPTTHNIHPMPKNNREWNMSQPPGAAPIVRKFTRPEIMIPVKCNQHPWMKAYIGVTSNPFFAVTGAGGTFSIKGLPPGEYTIEAWTATFGTQELKLTVRPNETTAVDFVFQSR